MPKHISISRVNTYVNLCTLKGYDMVLKLNGKKDVSKGGLLVKVVLVIVLHITHLANISVHEAHVQIVSLQRVKLLIPRASRIFIELTMSKLMSSEFALRKVCKLITEFKLFEAVSKQSKTHRNNMIAEKELEIVVLVIEMVIEVVIEMVIEVVIEKKAVGVFLQLKILH